jgi:hypothetical protein
MSDVRRVVLNRERGVSLVLANCARNRIVPADGLLRILQN